MYDASQKQIDKASAIYFPAMRIGHGGTISTIPPTSLLSSKIRTKIVFPDGSRNMDEPPVPGAFPKAPDEDAAATNRAPKKRFVGRRTAEAQARLRQDANNNSAVEETTAVVQKGMDNIK